MNQAMKQRLVGTLVLGCLALIFIPLLLDGEGMSPSIQSTALPPAPELPAVSIAEPERPLILADTGALADDTNTSAVSSGEVTNTTAAPLAAAAPATESAVAEPETTTAPVDAIPPSVEIPAASETAPALDAAGLPEAWAVRFGSFGDRANAETLMNKLLEAGYKAYSRPVQSGTVTLTGVFVGPVLTRSEANMLAQEVPRKLQLKENGFVMKFQVNQ